MSQVDHSVSPDEGHRIAGAIREALARRRMSRQALADKAKISISTVEKVLSGRRPFTVATLVRFEEALGVALRPAQAPPAAAVGVAVGVAPDDLGSYTRRAVAWIEGVYLTLRPSFGDKDAVYAYSTEIFWDDAASSLTFRESQRLDAAFTQFGVVSVPNQSGHIYLITNRHGQIRLITVARPTISGEMHGILTTLQAGRGAQLTPIAAPIVFVRAATMPDAEYGRIDAGHRCYAAYRRSLKRTLDEPFALFISG